MSHPAWVRGLKPKEMRQKITKGYVAPCVGAWIETTNKLYIGQYTESHPAWVRGLKHCQVVAGRQLPRVAPCVGAWIETEFKGEVMKPALSRTLRGCVD